MGRRILAIFRKEAQDLVTNFNVSFIFVLPLGIVVLFQRMMSEMSSAVITAFGLLFLLAMGGIYVPSMLVAEEKDKRTLEVLMLSPATPFEIFFGKGLLTLVFMAIFALLIYLVQGVPAAQIPLLLAIFLLGVCASIPLGMVIGMLAPNLLSTGLVGMPLYMGFTFLPLFAERGAAWRTVARLVPTGHVYDTTFRILSGSVSDRQVLEAVAWLIGIAALAFVLLWFAYRKRATTLV